jgi:hypothetical protein
MTGVVHPWTVTAEDDRVLLTVREAESGAIARVSLTPGNANELAAMILVAADRTGIKPFVSACFAVARQCDEPAPETLRSWPADLCANSDRT